MNWSSFSPCSEPKQGTCFVLRPSADVLQSQWLEHLPLPKVTITPTPDIIVLEILWSLTFSPTLDTIVLKIMKVNIFLRPEEAMLENWQKLVFCWNIILFLEKTELVSTLKMVQNVMRNINLHDTQCILNFTQMVLQIWFTNKGSFYITLPVDLLFDHLPLIVIPFTQIAMQIPFTNGCSFYINFNCWSFIRSLYP